MCRRQRSHAFQSIAAMGIPIRMPEPGTNSADCSACPAGNAHTTGADPVPKIEPSGQKSQAAPAFSMFIGSATTASSRGAGTPVIASKTVLVPCPA
jgi:hypothetical protein